MYIYKYRNRNVCTWVDLSRKREQKLELEREGDLLQEALAGARHQRARARTAHAGRHGPFYCDWRLVLKEEGGREPREALKRKIKRFFFTWMVNVSVTGVLFSVGVCVWRVALFT